jgi:hypothetical protein
MNSNAQGSLEFLLILGGAIILAVTVISVLSMTSSASDSSVKSSLEGIQNNIASASGTMPNITFDFVFQPEDSPLKSFSQGNAKLFWNGQTGFSLLVTNSSSSPIKILKLSSDVDKFPFFTIDNSIVQPNSSINIGGVLGRGYTGEGTENFFTITYQEIPSGEQKLVGIAVTGKTQA